MWHRQGLVYGMHGRIWHVQNGMSLLMLQTLGGWTTINMVLRYAHYANEHLMSYAGNVSKAGLNSEES
jgi:hypothetical protein